MKGFRTALLGACAILAASCSTPSAKINGTLTGAPEKDVIIKLLDVNTYNVLDTVKTDKSGAFSYKVNVAEGQPEFIYIFYGDNKVSSLLLQAGDNVTVTADTLGNGTVSGSEESVRLQNVEKEYAQFVKEVNAAETNVDANRAYVQYYRKCLKYVLENKGSISVVPVLFQSVTPDLPVFSQTTDALHFRASLDTLQQLYPDSKYVKALENETVRREQILHFNNQLSTAQESSYPDIKTKDINGKDLRLSEIDAKAIFIHFWTVTDTASKLFNTDTLMPLYEDYHSKGFEILEISLDTDKAAWANVVKNQKLPWINVNDGLGTASPAVSLYNVTALPQSFLILNGEILTKKIDSENALRKLLDSNL